MSVLLWMDSGLAVEAQARGWVLVLRGVRPAGEGVNSTLAALTLILAARGAGSNIKLVWEKMVIIENDRA